MAMSRGGRNLLILGLGAISITLVTTGVSLFIYKQTGDIYLDRSRPGFLPDKEEVEQNNNTSTGDFEFSETGKLTAEDLDAYLDALEQVNRKLKDLDEPYSSAPLSDESLGI